MFGHEFDSRHLHLVKCEKKQPTVGLNKQSLSLSLVFKSFRKISTSFDEFNRSKTSMFAL